MRTATAAVAILFAAVSPPPTCSADSSSDRAHVKTSRLILVQRLRKKSLTTFLDLKKPLLLRAC